MASNGIFFTPIRFISRTCIRPKTAGLGSFGKKDELNIKEQVEVPVEKDTEKLATYVCGSNLFNEGEDVKLKPDSEYPDWLWTMRLPPPLEELDKNTKTYWNRIRRIREREIKYLNSLQRHKSVHK